MNFNSETETFWWEADEELVHESLFPYVSQVEENQQSIHTANLWHAKLYSNRMLTAMDWGSWGIGSTDANRPLKPVRYNVCQNVVDTATAMIGRNQVRPVTMTDGASFSQMQRAAKQDKFLLGVFQGEYYWKKAAMAFRDACIFGTGFLKFSVDPDREKVCIDRLFPDEVIVDETECISNDTPLQIHHRKVVDREALKAEYPDFADKIDAAQSSDRYVSYRRPLSTHLIVIESWILPLGDREGRHCICIENADLFDEEWDEHCFPIRWVKYTEPVAGFYGQGLVEQIAGIQLQINKLNRHIDSAMHFSSVPRTLIPASSGVKREHITNAVDGVIPYKGNIPPSMWVGNAVHPEVFRRLDDLVESAFNFAGISQLRAQAQKPGGLDSGKALREFTGIQDDRFAINVMDMEQLALESAEAALAAAKRAWKNSKVNAFVSWRNRDVSKQINWKDIKLDKERPVMRVEAANILTKTPSGRQADVADLIRSGFISNDEAKRLIAHPDIDRWAELDEANWTDAEEIVEMLLDGERVPAPEDFEDLGLLMQVANKTYLKIKNMKDVPDEILFGFTDYISLVKVKLEAIQQLEQEKMMAQQQQMMQQQMAMEQQSAQADLQKQQAKGQADIQKAQISGQSAVEAAAVGALGSNNTTTE